MFWADSTVQDIEKRFSEKAASGAPIVVRDEKTASGRVHVGSLRGVAIHGIIAEILAGKGIAAKYLFEINDFDPMDGIPAYLDQEKYAPYLGKPLCDIPSPDGAAANFAEYYAQEFIGVIKEIGFDPEFYRSSEVYRSGRYNGCIKAALESAGAIREIYKRVSGSVRDDSWLPVQMICEKCGKVSTTKALSFDGSMVAYVCSDLEWTKGCGYKGAGSPFDGHAKLPWKVEWAAKFKVIGVDVEGAGKDHSTKGGSRDVAEAIAREVFATEPPFNIPYEFFHVNGRKMSSSKGAGSSSREMADLLPPQILRLLLLQKVPQRVIDFVPDGDTVPILYDGYDKLAKSYFAHAPGDDSRVFSLVHFPAIASLLAERFLPRFSEVAYLVQMPHIDVVAEVEKQKGSALTEGDKAEIALRRSYAKRWLDAYAPEDYKFDIQAALPAQAASLSAIQKEALGKVLGYVRSQSALDGQGLHTALHDIRKSMGIEPKDYFEAIYLSFLGKPSGPKAGWFLSVLDKAFVEQRLSEASAIARPS
ncbi:MAG: lysine--tRNA ligase [Patescibacteria group bacterium]|nr:lysine--tRNA ligase [Patescibacteria group bacterium]